MKSSNVSIVMGIGITVLVAAFVLGTWEPADSVAIPGRVLSVSETDSIRGAGCAYYRYYLEENVACTPIGGHMCPCFQEFRSLPFPHMHWFCNGGDAITTWCPSIPRLRTPVCHPDQFFANPKTINCNSYSYIIKACPDRIAYWDCEEPGGDHLNMFPPNCELAGTETSCDSATYDVRDDDC